MCKALRKLFDTTKAKRSAAYLLYDFRRRVWRNRNVTVPTYPGLRIVNWNWPYPRQVYTLRQFGSHPDDAFWANAGWPVAADSYNGTSNFTTGWLDSCTTANGKMVVHVRN